MANGATSSDPFVKNLSMALTRGGVYFSAGVAVGYGLIHGETALTIAGAVATALAGGWTANANTNSSIAQAFSQIPAAKYVEVSDPKLASVMKSADPNTEVKVVKEAT